jgi:hypothetical protein
LLFVIAFALKSISTGSENELIVYSTPGYATIGVKSGKNLKVFSDNPDLPPEVIRHSSVLGLKTELRTLTESAILIEAGNRCIIIYDKPVRGWKMAENADIIIITGKGSFYESDLPSIITLQGQAVILAVSGTNVVRTADRVPYHDNRIRSVKESGAVRVRL